MNCIVINIGNSNIRFGFFSNGICEKSWIINTKPYRTRDELFSQFGILYHTYHVDIQNIDKVVIGSVVPQLTHISASALRRIHGDIPIAVVDRNTPSEVTHHSNQMGTDIYANLVAAHEIYREESRKKIILDFGTALTASCIDESGDVLGVIIAPGIVTALNSLIQETAQLPEIELNKPETVLGKDTVSSMRSGIVYGYLGMVEGFIDRINAETNSDCFVIATGGVSHVYHPLTKKIHVGDKIHTLKGLYILGNGL